MTFEIDPCLDRLNVPYLTLPNASAWETLQSIADFALCRFYAARDGRIRAEYDMCTCQKTPLADVAITPDNTFSHRLPLQPKLIVNRVVVPYIELVEIHTDTLDEFKIQLNESDAIIENDCFVFEVSFKNFYPTISKFAIRKDVTEIDVGFQVRELYSDKIKFVTNKFTFKDSKVELLITGTYSYEKRPNKIYQQKDSQSLKQNGLNEYSHPATPLFIGTDSIKAFALARAQAIISKYGEGLDYAEVEWKGTPELYIGARVHYHTTGETPGVYTCLSNEMTFTGGLRCKTILRKE